MIRAFIMWLANPMYEVRLINTKSGKEIPGRLVTKGSYFKCRKAFKRKRLKYGQMLRLQAVAVLDYKVGRPVTRMEVQEAVNVETRKRVDEAKAEIDESRDEPYYMPVSEPAVDNPLEEITDLYIGEHDCDKKGPMDWDFDADDYLPTCSICGELQP